ncbi:uncharacterized protein LOC126717301 isoform X3 [Quercus robur]|uniref:uncharacterized protein LOC126717301 isoform X3 n=1 Tax=Quercus robur TaxID=38942 RepID=UPI002163C5BB|nr:uncharacterized protein LOC126717301 isoform X3 [Quercus robur]
MWLNLNLKGLREWLQRASNPVQRCFPCFASISSGIYDRPRRSASSQTVDLSSCASNVSQDGRLACLSTEGYQVLGRYSINSREIHNESSK